MEVSMYSIAGKVAWVDLSDKTVKIEPTEKYK
jgi:hypothetical protein